MAQGWKGGCCLFGLAVFARISEPMALCILPTFLCAIVITLQKPAFDLCSINKSAGNHCPRQTMLEQNKVLKSPQLFFKTFTYFHLVNLSRHCAVVRKSLGGAKVTDCLREWRTMVEREWKKAETLRTLRLFSKTHWHVRTCPTLLHKTSKQSQIPDLFFSVWMFLIF